MAVCIPLSTVAFLPSTEGTMVFPPTMAKACTSPIQTILTPEMLSTYQEHNRAILVKLHIKHECLITRHTQELEQQGKSADNCCMVLESQQEMERALLTQELNLQESVLKAAHASELDTMDSTILTLGCSLEILDFTIPDKKDKKATTSGASQIFCLSFEGFVQFTARCVCCINTH